MGSSASIAYGEYLSKEDLITLYGNYYDEELFQKLKNSDNLILTKDVEKLVDEKKSQIKSVQLNEIQRLFKLYCPTNKMTSRNFIQYLRDAKLLNKNKFSAADAEITFNNIKNSQEIISSTLDCATFISSLSILAEKLKIPRDTLIVRLSKVEYDLDTKLRPIHDSEITSPTSTAATVPLPPRSLRHTRSTTTDGTNNTTQHDERSHAAAVKLQSFSRGHVAQKQLKDIREISLLSSSTELSSRSLSQYLTLSTNPHHPEIENKLSDIFLTYCPDKEMNLTLFLKLIQDTNNLLNSTSFTLNDCKYCFEKTKSIALKSPQFSHQVVLEKRINYEIFRNILIPCMAERYGNNTEPEEIIKYLIEIPSNTMESLNINNYSAQNFFTKALLSHR